MNEVEIVVVAHDKTGPGFASARQEAKKAGDSIVRDMDRSGRDASTKLTQGFKAGATGAKMGTDVGKGLVSSIVSNIGGGNAQTAIAGVLITTASFVAPIVGPIIGGAIGGAIVGAAGAGGIIGGILLVKDDPRVRAAAQEAGTAISTGLKLAAAPIVEPLIKAMKVLEVAAQRSMANMARIFAKSSTWLDPLSRSIGSTLEKLSGGFARLVESGDGPMKALGYGIEFLGTSINKVLVDLSNAGPGAAIGLKLAFQAAGIAIQAVGNIVVNLTKILGFLAEKGILGPKIKKDFQDFKAEAERAKGAGKNIADSFDKIGQSADGAADSAKKLGDALAAETDPVFALMNAQRGLREAQTAYNEAVRTGGKNSADAKARMQDMAIAALRMQSAAAGAGNAMAQKLTPQLRATLTAAGWTAAEISDLERQFNQARAAGNSFSKKYQASIAFQGAGAAIGEARRVAAAISRIPSTKVITIRTSTIGGFVGTAGFATGGVVSRAPGMSSVRKMATGKMSISADMGAAANGGARRGLTLVGEQGPELVNLAPGSQVHSAGNTRAMMTPNAGSGSNTVTINFSGSVDTVMAAAFQKLMRDGLITISGRYVTA